MFPSFSFSAYIFSSHFSLPFLGNVVQQSHFILFIFFLRIRTNIVQNFFGTYQACFCSVVVITCASHAQGPQFDPGQKHSKLINFRVYCSDKQVYLIRVRSLKIVLLFDEKVCLKNFILIKIFASSSMLFESMVLHLPRKNFENFLVPEILELSKSPCFHSVAVIKCG